VVGTEFGELLDAIYRSNPFKVQLSLNSRLRGR
jgi:hypothetical protein